MNILLLFIGFIIAFVIVLYYERKIRNLHLQLKNKAHFYVARDRDGTLWLYISKPHRENDFFQPSDNGYMAISQDSFYKFGLNEKDYNNLKWEDEPVEVFLNLED